MRTTYPGHHVLFECHNNEDEGYTLRSLWDSVSRNGKVTERKLEKFLSLWGELKMLDNISVEFCLLGYTAV
jgi:hypothetical protein